MRQSRLLQRADGAIRGWRGSGSRRNFSMLPSTFFFSREVGLEIVFHSRVICVTRKLIKIGKVEVTEIVKFYFRIMPYIKACSVIIFVIYVYTLLKIF